MHIITRNANSSIQVPGSTSSRYYQTLEGTMLTQAGMAMTRPRTAAACAAEGQGRSRSAS